MSRAWSYLGISALAFTLQTSCAGQRRSGTQSPSPSGETAVLETAPILLERGDKALESQAWSPAATAYRKVLAAKPNQARQGRALQGLAKARVKMGDCAGANRALTTLLRLNAQSLDDASLQRVYSDRGICSAELLQWEQSAKDLQMALQIKHDPGLAKQMELHARAGLALFHSEAFEDARKEFQSGIALYAALDSEVRERLADPYFLAMSHFYLGAIAHRRFFDITLNLPESRMAKELEQKVQLLEELQSHYHDSIRVRHVFWVSAAGYQLGSAFERFYDEMMQSPVPPRLSPSQRAVFYTELKKKIRPVLLRAVDVYEKNIAAAKRLGYSTPFVDETKARLAQLQHYLVSEMSSGPFAPPPLDKRARSRRASGGEQGDLVFSPEPTGL